MSATSSYLNLPLLSLQQRLDVTAAGEARANHAALVAALVRSLRDEPDELYNGFLVDAAAERSYPGHQGLRTEEAIAADAVAGEKRRRQDMLEDSLIKDASKAFDMLKSGLHDDCAPGELREAADAFDSLACRLLALIEANEKINALAGK